MPYAFEPQQFGALPLWGQVLLAARLVRRAVLAASEDLSPAAREFVLGCCDTIEECAKQGHGTTSLEKAPSRVDGLIAAAAGGARPVLRGLYYAIDAARAAEAANDFPVDATVTNSAREAIAAIAQDPRVSALQVSILLAGDLDQVRFTCGEARIGTYDGLTNYVFERITPVHALTHSAPRRSPEEEYR